MLSKQIHTHWNVTNDIKVSIHILKNYVWCKNNYLTPHTFYDKK